MRKILITLLAVAMLLGGLVGTASAGFSDTAKSTDIGYIEKVSAFNWMKGYPDGSFKPAGNITRAEFAAVVVRALGMESAAASVTGLQTKFSDVAKTHWAVGYINVATGRGILKGYPDGTFKPEANVTNAEAITMVVRALNRESDAVGEWPVGHIAVAATNSIIGSGFASNALATRADVSRYIAKASTVAFKVLKTEGWVEDSSKTFVRSNSMERVEGTVEDINTSSKTITVKVTGSTLTSSSTNASAIGYVANPAQNWTYTLADNAVIGGGTLLQDLKGYSVAVYLTTDPNIRALFVEQTSTATVKKGDLHTIGTGVGTDGNYFYLYDDATKYSVASDARVYRNGTEIANAAATDKVSKLVMDDTVTFFINTNGAVSYINARAYDYSRWVVTDVYTAGTPNSISIRRALTSGSDPALGSGGTPATYSDYSKVITVNADAKVEVNGVPGKLSDLKKDDMVSISVDSSTTAGSPAVPVSTTATLVSGWNKRVEGKVTAKRTYTSEASAGAYYLSVDGVEYRLESSAEVKDQPTYVNARRLIAGIDLNNDGDFADANEIEPKIKTGQQVSIVLSERNRVRFVDITTGSADYGKIKNFNVGAGSYDQWIMDIRGTSTTYEVAKDSNGTSKHWTLVNTGTLAAGDVVQLSIDTDGRITGATKVPSQIYKITNVYSGDKLITADRIVGGALAGAPATMVGSTDTVAYVNNAYASGFGSVTQNAYAYIDTQVVNDVTKIRAIVVDTFTTIDAAAITATKTGAGPFDYTVTGTKGAAEASAVVTVYGTTDIGATPLATVTADGPTKDYPGKFTTTFNNATTFTTLYVKVTDKMGNVTSAPITVR